MNDIKKYLSDLMWQFTIIFNYVMRIISNIYTYFYQIYYTKLSYYYPPHDIAFIKNSEIKFTCTYNNFLTMIFFSNFDYYVFNHTVNNQILKKISTNIEDLQIYKDIELNKNLMLKPCNFQFIMVLFKIADDSIDVTNIINNKDSFYYVQEATIFDRNFINWIGINHLKKPLNNVTVVFLDDIAQEITLNSNQYIKLGTTAYTIITED